MARQQLDGVVDDYLSGYKKKVRNILRWRLRLLSPTEAKEVVQKHPVGQMRMLLEVKRDGRKKARLGLQGFREPSEWDDGSTVSSVVYCDTVRLLLFTAGSVLEVISTNDVSVAFLQSHGYSSVLDPRFVSYKAYKQAWTWIFQLHGPIYGQRAAGKKWYITMAGWLCGQGFKQCENDPCLFVNGVTGVKVALYCDDLLVRGTVDSSLKFHSALENRFECRPGSRQFLTPDNNIDYTGFTLTMEVKNNSVYYYMAQGSEVLKFLKEFDMADQAQKSSPAPTVDMLTSDLTKLGVNDATKCRSMLEKLKFFASGTRWDIAETVSRLSGELKETTVGLMESLHYLCGYLNGTVSFRV